MLGKRTNKNSEKIFNISDLVKKPWESNTTRTNPKKGTESKGTYKKDYLPNRTNERRDKEKMYCKPFKTYEESVEYYNEKLRDKNRDKDNGFYKTGVRGRHKVQSLRDMEKQYKAGLNENKRQNLYPCYKDIHNKNSLVWLLCWYDC
jgi:hypothetical protein